ncbi:PREDICTED: uncharacterized protein LOC104823832 [Tarenaya hassleriana]|uniref:uncharacterized protein LOC104823832 n=1 Tax=Tarenaya hassleriana TaxID=28532 RepID=UPI00053C6A70|nr:PREDICTED: uncharacterized protein LOC104823832 [Tarenaya hassleriana]
MCICVMLLAASEESKMGGWMTSSSWELMERAEEELEILQTQHPNRFQYLKSELESFIFLLRENHAPPPISGDVVLTQASSNCKKKKSKKKRKRMDKSGDQVSSLGSKKKDKRAQRTMAESKDRVDMVLEKAQLCLEKIRDVKSSLC